MCDLHVALAELLRLGKERRPTAAPAEALERLEVVAEQRVDLLAVALRNGDGPSWVKTRSQGKL